MLNLWLLVTAVAFVVHVPLLLWRSNPTAPGKCGACGYRVADLESMTCPECGHDVRYYGIRASTFTVRSARVGAMISWSCLCGLLVLTWGFTGSVMSEHEQPVRVTGAWTHDSGLLPAVSFEASKEGRLYYPGRIELTLVGADGATRSVTITETGVVERTSLLGFLSGGPAIRSAAEARAEIEAERASIRTVLDGVLEDSGYGSLDGIEEVARSLGAFVSRAMGSTEHLDAQQLSFQSRIRVDSAEGTYAASRAAGMFNTDPVVLARMGVRVLIVAAVWVVGFIVLRWVLHRHERRVRAGSVAVGAS